VGEPPSTLDFLWVGLVGDPEPSGVTISTAPLGALGASGNLLPSVFILRIRKLRPRKGSHGNPESCAAGMRAAPWSARAPRRSLVWSCGHKVLGPPKPWRSCVVALGPASCGAERGDLGTACTSSRLASISSSTTLETEGNRVTEVIRTQCRVQGQSFSAVRGLQLQRVLPGPRDPTPGHRGSSLPRPGLTKASRPAAGLSQPVGHTVLGL